MSRNGVYDGLVRAVLGVRWVGTGWVPGWAIPGTTQLLGEGLQTAKRAPEAPAGCWSGWSAGPGARSPENKAKYGTLGRRRGRLLRPPFGPGRSLAGPSLSQDPRNAASWPIRARFTVISHKVSQNGVVSPKIVYKACHSPCFQNGHQKSPLEFLRFPYSVAFSHKELMGHY